MGKYGKESTIYQGKTYKLCALSTNFGEKKQGRYSHELKQNPLEKNIILKENIKNKCYGMVCTFTLDVEFFFIQVLSRSLAWASFAYWFLLSTWSTSWCNTNFYHFSSRNRYHLNRNDAFFLTAVVSPPLLSIFQRGGRG